jgi:D-beta-D-heptose 7-phosphate kinase/D-beta-D-heptose 1-phosphate adenosyltransferase
MSDGLALQAHLDRFAGRRILCVGDGMLDRYVDGDVVRVSAEAPIPILQQRDETSMLGGAGNVARNVVALGGEAVLVAVVGDDAAGGEIRALIEADPAIVDALVIAAGRPSSVKTRFVAAGQQLLRTDRETTAALPADTAEAVLARIEAHLPQCDAMILSDYAKGTLCDDVLGRAIEFAQAAGVPVLADPKRDDFTAYAGVTVLTPNRAEWLAATGDPGNHDDAVEASARQIIERCGIGNILLTRSEQGASLIAQSGDALHLPARALEVYDVSGAGDTVAATLALTLAAGAPLADAARLANLAGGVAVSKTGTATVSNDELATALVTHDLSPAEAKIASANVAAATVARWRSRGLKVGFTNGCFDLLHPGHVSLIREAADSCDRLIVAINSDESVRRLKGEGRPVQNETARAMVLASLADADLVVVFDDDTPIPLLERLRPDVLVKGGDYTVETVVGGDVVQEYGGEVRLAVFVDGHSSSAMIARSGSAKE